MLIRLGTVLRAAGRWGVLRADACDVPGADPCDVPLSYKDDEVPNT